jgi:hydrogenase expression/formation protein HypE
MELDSTQIPVREDVKAACEILGFDPLYVANEGCMVAFIPAKDVDQALDIMTKYPQCQSAQVIGKVLDSTRGKVLLKSPLGATRVLDKLSGEQLPRIC